MTKEIKCPHCGNQGQASLRGFINWFDCWFCGLSKRLKVFNQQST